MIVDTSALVALFLLESGHAEIADVIDGAEAAFVSVASRIETVLVLCGKRFEADPARVAGFIDVLHLEEVHVTSEQMHLAVAALLTYGGGRHPAKLNFGDCFPYALAKSLGARLLYTGEDFTRTDITPAWIPVPP